MEKMPRETTELTTEQLSSTSKTTMAKFGDSDSEQATTYGEPVKVPMKTGKLDNPNEKQGAKSIDGQAPIGDQNASTNNQSTRNGTLSNKSMQSAEVSDEDNEENSSTAALGLDMNTTPKKKKKRKSRKSKTSRKITGFEDGYADTPTTPQEYYQEKKLYAKEIPFVQRIEECIQRYRAKRLLNNPRAFLFDKFLLLGGVDSSQRQFQGMGLDEAKTATSEEIRAMTSRDVIHHGYAGSKFYDLDDAEHWVVDFEGIVKGFLSRFVSESYPQSDMGQHADNEQAANLVSNFLNYILQHDVCPEYKSQIYAARAICEIAPTEMHNVHELFRDIPDSFNTAACHLFYEGGIHTLEKAENQLQDVANPEWGGLDTNITPKKLNPFTQLAIFRFSVMSTTKDEKLKEVVGQDDLTQIRVVNTKEQQTYQVVSVHRPSRKKKDLWQRLLEAEGQGDAVKPVGTIILRPSMIDHPYSNIPRPDQVDFSKEPTERFILDDNILAKIEIGMKLELTICELNIGLRFIKQVLDVRPSFDTFLPQSLMLSWKDPVENERPAPSVHNTPAEEKTYEDGPFDGGD